MDANMKRVKNETSDELDRITALPAHLKELILEFLSIRDAMRTSILSSKWRYSWIGMQVFDLEDMALDRYVGVDLFRKTVDRILLLHSGPIQFISFFFPQHGDYLDINLYDWFLVLSKKEVKSIVVDAFKSGNQIMLPCSLFQWSGLERLELYSFKLTPPPNFVGFDNLVYLVINSCILPSDILGSIISHCPLLEELSLSYTCKHYAEQPLIIRAPNLKTLWFEDDIFGTIVFQQVPKLSYASLSANNMPYIGFERPCISWDFICSMPTIRELQFSIFLLGAVIGKSPRYLPTILKNLKIMALFDVNACVGDDICLLLCLIRSSPCLQNLSIMFDHTKIAWLPDAENSLEEARKLLETEASDKSTLSNLSTILFHSIEWFEPESMLVKVLLSRCPNIKSFEISPIPSQCPVDVIQQISSKFTKLPIKKKLIYQRIVL